MAARVIAADAGAAAQLLPHDLLQRAPPDLPASLQARFDTGLAIFNTPFQAGTAAPRRVSGLGPRYNSLACDACHNSGGRGSVPEGPEQPAQATVHARVRDSKAASSHAYVMRLGAIAGVDPDARVRVIWSSREGRYADGERYTLREPRLELSTPRADLAEIEATSLRIPTALAGLGLLQAIPQASLCPAAGRDTQGLTGRCAQVHDVHGRLRMGRFGWKATQADVESQTADALAVEMGIVTRWHAPLEQSGAPAEMRDEDLAALVFLQSASLAPPAHNDRADAHEHGHELFRAFRCDTCHRESWMTAEVPDAPWLSHRHISPYTDLRLHDLGPGLAAAGGEGDASAAEWRTAPLWGLSLTGRIGLGRTYLHDGRARDLAEAILWHGGEAQDSHDRFAAASAADRDALVRFLGSL